MVQLIFLGSSCFHTSQNLFTPYFSLVHFLEQNLRLKGDTQVFIMLVSGDLEALRMYGMP
jgi:hypothetical protein